jgi:iron complex transport system permease protein
VVLPPAEIPAGAVLALLGGPYLVWVIRRRAPLEA